MKNILLIICVLCLSGTLIQCKKSDPVEPKKDPPVEETPALPVGPTTTVALAGNAYVTSTVPADEIITSTGLANWNNSNTITSTYFRVNRTGKLTVHLKAKVAPAGNSSTIKVTVNGTAFNVNLSGADSKTYAVGSVNIQQIGYVKIDLQGVSKTGVYFGDVSDIILSDYVGASNVVYANDASNYYWSRRGPSVHMGYTAPAGTNTEWFYNELTVPVGEDKIGSYFMSNGFSEGYCGIQVNSSTERRVLFSVWDPSQGKTTLVKKGTNVVDNTFGGEGTGGQSYLVFNWKAGTTYKFLTQGKPDGQGNTLYSSWFYNPDQAAWVFIATWKRPNTNTYLTGLHSFLENFIDNNGYMGRKVLINNQWVRSSAGVWTEITAGRFTCDATGSNNQRLDFAGGVENGHFYLKNGGYFSNYVNPNASFTRTATGQQPTVDLTTLP